MSFIITVLLFIIFLITLFIYYVHHKFAYWAIRSVPFIEPKFPSGNLRRDVHTSILFQQFYNQLKVKSKTKNQSFGGIFFFIVPVVITLNLDFVKNVLVKDFQYFMNRGVYHNEEDDPLTAHLVALEGVKWKNLRSKLTPTFSSGKMKFMFPTIIAVGEKFQQCLEKAIIDDSMIQIKDLVSRYTTDVIGTCAFGIECNSLDDPATQFRTMSRKLLENPRRGNIFKRFFVFAFSDLARKFHVKVIDEEVSGFFMDVVRETVSYREINNVQRNDFMSLLIQLKNGAADESLTINEIAAQVFAFFLAGYETSATTISFVLYELALNQEIQDRARNELKEAMSRHNGELSYECCSELKYLDQIINGKN